MAIKVKAIGRLFKFNKDDTDEYRYVMQAELYISLKEQQIIRQAPLSEGAAEGANFAGLRVFTGRPASFNAQACQ